MHTDCNSDELEGSALSPMKMLVIAAIGTVATWGLILMVVL